MFDFWHLRFFFSCSTFSSSLTLSASKLSALNQIREHQVRHLHAGYGPFRRRRRQQRQGLQRAQLARRGRVDRACEARRKHADPGLSCRGDDRGEDLGWEVRREEIMRVVCCFKSPERDESVMKKNGKKVCFLFSFPTPIFDRNAMLFRRF